MNKTPSILMVCWNRREYLERTVAHLLADPSDFRLYFWDNGSTDGVAEFIAGLDDPRIAKRHFSETNVAQAPAWHWFMENAEGDIAGKLDDDILGPVGWPARLAGMIAEEPRLGLMGGWMFMPSDWNEALAAHKIVLVGKHRVFRNGWVGGCIFLGRLELLRRFTSYDPSAVGTPINQNAITEAGYVNGFPLPLEMAENLDDPRHPDCRMNRPGGWDQYAAYTARRMGLAGPEEYGRWIAQDARKLLTETIEQQLERSRANRKVSFMQRVRRRIGRILASSPLPLS